MLQKKPVSKRILLASAIDPARDAEKNKFLGVISYFWVFCIVPLVAKKSSPFAQFHAKQGVIVALAWFCLWLLAFIPILGTIIVLPGMVALMTVNLLAIIRAWRGEQWKIPYLHNYVAKFNL